MRVYDMCVNGNGDQKRASDPLQLESFSQHGCWAPNSDPLGKQETCFH